MPSTRKTGTKSVPKTSNNPLLQRKPQPKPPATNTTASTAKMKAVSAASKTTGPMRGKAAPLTPAQQYAQSKGFPPLPEWAKDFKPAVVEANKYRIWRSLGAAKAVQCGKGQHPWQIFRKESHKATPALTLLSTIAAKGAADAVAQARKLYPQYVGQMELLEITS